MIEDTLSTNMVREADGSFSAVYGPFALRSAFQPIFRRMGDGKVRLDAFEGLIRPTKGDQGCSPFAFFSAVPAEDRAMIDALCRRLHLLNMGQMNRPSASLFLNFDPSLFESARVTAREADGVAELAYRIGLPGPNIVREITEKRATNRAALVAVVEDLRERGFRIAVDDFGADESDIARIELLQPDIVKFDGDWVLRFMENPPGLEVLRGATERFHNSRITTLFEGLEEDWHVETALSLGVDLLQGYALAKPEQAFRRLNELFPEDARSAASQRTKARKAADRPRDAVPAPAAPLPQAEAPPAAAPVTAPIRQRDGSTPEAARQKRRAFGRRGG